MIYYIDWRLVAKLSMFGLVMALATVWVIPVELESYVWDLIFIVSAFMIAEDFTDQPFLHGFVASIANCFWMTLIHLLFAETYIEGHPDEAVILFNGPLDGSPMIMMVIFGLFMGIASGILLGVLAVVASKVFKKYA